MNKEWVINPVAKYICRPNENGIGLSGNEIHVIEHAEYERLRRALEYVVALVDEVDDPEINEIEIKAIARRALDEGSEG